MMDANLNEASSMPLTVGQQLKAARDARGLTLRDIAGITKMQAAPVELRERMAGSTVGAKAILRTMREALTIFGRLHMSSTYREHHAPVISLPIHLSDELIPQAA